MSEKVRVPHTTVHDSRCVWRGHFESVRSCTLVSAKYWRVVTPPLASCTATPARSEKELSNRPAGRSISSAEAMPPKVFRPRRNGATAASPPRAPARPRRACVRRAGADGRKTRAMPGHPEHHFRVAPQSGELQPEAARLFERTRAGTVLDSERGSAGRNRFSTV